MQVRLLPLPETLDDTKGTSRSLLLPRSSSSPLPRRLLQLASILLRRCARAEPGRCSPPLLGMDRVLYGCLCLGGCRGFGQFVAWPNCSITKSWCCQIVGLPNAGTEALWMVAFAAVARTRVGKGEDLTGAAAPEEKASLGATSPSPGQAVGAPKAGVFAGPLSPSYRGSRLRVSGLGQGSDPIRW